MTAVYFVIAILILTLIIIYMILQQRKPNKTGLTKFILVLVVTMVLFLLTTAYGSYHRIWTAAKSAEFINQLNMKYGPRGSFVPIPSDASNISPAMQNLSTFQPTADNSTKVLINGQATYESLFKDLQSATNHIHIEDFILRDDETSRNLQDILIAKAKSGVKVRLLFDGFGINLRQHSIKRLRDSGVQLVIVNPSFRSIVTGYLNNRDHRKIFIIDGKIAYTGGINVGDEYLGKDRRIGYWRDTDIRVTGSAAKQLQMIFISSWYIQTGENLDHPSYFPDNPSGSEILQVVNGVPGAKFNSIEYMYNSLINSAHRSVYIETPYLILDEQLFASLSFAALRGVDVRIIIPSKPDEMLDYSSTLHYSKKVSDYGVKIYKYSKGFIHAKTMVVDGNIATIGTANFNNRSLHLDYENNLIIYDGPSVKELYDNFLTDISDSRLTVQDDLVENKLTNRIMQKIAVLLSPIE